MTSDLAYECFAWESGGKRHVMLKANLAVMPYVRQTRHTRWRGAAGERAREYNESQARIRDVVKVIMAKEGIEPFGNVRLGFQSWFWLSPTRVLRGSRLVTVDDPARCDLGNLEKALEDALTGALYPDDVNIWRRGEGFKAHGTESGFAVHVWELGDEAHLRILWLSECRARLVESDTQAASPQNGRGPAQARV